MSKREYIRKLDLSDQERAALKEAYRSSPNRHIAQRIQCVLLKAQGMKANQIKEVVMLSENHISHWVQAYVEEGLNGLMVWGYKGRPCDLDSSKQEILKEALEKHLFSTSLEVQSYVDETLGQSYSLRAIQYLLKGLIIASRRQNVFQVVRLTFKHRRPLKKVLPAQSRIRWG
jgi:transposase